jgi:transcriptional regulator with XRE-family HTH domain
MISYKDRRNKHMKTLDEYLWALKKKNRHFKDKDFADKIGISPGYLSFLKIGIRIPSLKLALKIEKASNGELSAVELIKKALKEKEKKDNGKDRS